MIYNLPKEVSEQRLSQELEQFGPVAKIQMPFKEDPEGHATIYASREMNIVKAADYLGQT